MFVARLTRDPTDIMVFGRGLGLAFVPGRDDATAEGIDVHPRKAGWPRYIRVHHTEFVAGTMANGVSLSLLMRELGAYAFASTKANANGREDNTDARKAYQRKPAVELSVEGMSWISERLQSAFDRHGTVPQETLDLLPRPLVRLSI